MRRAGWMAALLGVAGLCGLAGAQVTPEDTVEASYRPSTLAKILGGTARAANDEAELAPSGDWLVTTATYTGNRRKPSGRLRPLISSWVSSRGEGQDVVELYFGGELFELQFEQAGRKYWVLAGLPGGMGFEVHPPGQKLTIYLQRVGYASGTPVAVLRMARLPDGAVVAAPAGGRLRQARLGEGARRQEGVFRGGAATFVYAGREYTLPLDAAGRHSVAPGLYRYENGVRVALLEYGSGDDQYLLLRVPVPEGSEGSSVVPYLVLGGRIVPPIDVGSCLVTVELVERAGARGQVDCSPVERSVLRQLRFSAQ